MAKPTTPYISREEWLDRWEAELLNGAAPCSRDEAIRRWEEKYGDYEGE